MADLGRGGGGCSAGPINESSNRGLSLDSSGKISIFSFCPRIIWNRSGNFPGVFWGGSLLFPTHGVPHAIADHYGNAWRADFECSITRNLGGFWCKIENFPESLGNRPGASLSGSRAVLGLFRPTVSPTHSHITTETPGGRILNARYLEI